jgi:protein-disulfide isomerase
MKLAQCRVEDPSCSYSTGLSAVVIESIKQGKTEAQAIAAAGASRWAHNQEQGKVLDDAVKIPVTGAPYTGPANAPITIVEFSDFQCPYCILAVPQIDAVLKNYPTQVKLIFKQFPLEIHTDAYRAAAASLAAHKQGKFWLMHNALFAHHNDLSMQSIMAIAKENGLDAKRLESDMESKETRVTIETDVKDGETAGVEGTPTIFINGQRYNGRIELSSLKPLLDSELKKTPTQTAAR